MRDLLRSLREAGFQVDFAVVRAGFYNDDDGGRLVDASEVRAFLASHADPELEPFRAAKDDAELASLLSQWWMVPNAEALANRKWCWAMASRRLASLSGDPLDALVELEEFWIEWGYPGPHGIVQGTAWHEAEQTLERVLPVNRAWLEQERAAILSADADPDTVRVAS